MKKIALVFCLVFTAGCANDINLMRSQIHTGMTFTQVRNLCGCDYSDPTTYEICTKLNESLEIVDKEAKGDCTLNTYRFSLSDSATNKPYLLTFQSCRLANYDAVQTEKKRRLNNYKEIIENNPDLQEEFDAFCKEQGVDPEDREIVIELLGYSKDTPLPRCTTDMTLVKITIDTGKDQRNISAIGKEQKRPKGLLPGIIDGACWVIKTTAKGAAINQNNSYVDGNTSTHLDSQGGGLQIDAYGLGVHMNQYGQPVRLRPDFGSVPGEQLQIKENAYGLGVHMDQYGRPVREYPWP